MNGNGTTNGLKGLHETRNDKITALEKLLGKAKTEIRAMDSTELEKFKTLESEIAQIDATIEAEERARQIPEKRTKVQDGKQAEEKFDAYLRGLEKRSETAQSTTLNENIIPSEFSTDIIRKVRELSGVYSAVGKISSTGVYKQIVEKNKITAGWTAELAEVTASTADFDILEIGHHKLGALVKLSYEIINQAAFPIVSEVTTQMVDAFTYKVEEALINGTGTGQPLGLMSGGTDFELAASTGISADELIKIFHALKAPYMTNAVWLMNRNTLCQIRLLKDTTGQYLFHEAELTSGYYGYILGKPISLSEVMPDYQLMFGDFGRAYKANTNPQMTIQVLNEQYATQGAKGVLGFLWLDGKPVNNEAYIVAKAE